MWDRWDQCDRWFQESLEMEEWARRLNPSDTGEIVAIKQEAVTRYALEIERHQRALWTVSFWFTLMFRTPLP
jgi:hypothetical protein